MHGSTQADAEVPAGSVIIVGVGLVGAVQALLFARAGFNVTVIEKKQLPEADHSLHAISSRTVALSYRSRQLLSDAGLWPAIDCCPIQTVHVSEQGNFGSIKLEAHKLDVEALGYVVSNAQFESYMYGLLKSEARIEVIESAKVVSVQNNSESADVTIEQSGVAKNLSASLVVAADGTHSAVREMLGIDTRQHDYQQCAVLANVCTSRSQKHCAYERFTRDGPLALLPLSAANDAGQIYSMIYTAGTAQSEELKALSDEDFLGLLQKKFGGRSGRFEKIGKRYVAPLSLTVSMQQTEGRFVLIGNAARTLHPVAGQGMNLALRDVFELVSSVVSIENIDSALAHFVKKRNTDQWWVTQQTDLLARLFVDKPWPLRLPVSFMTGAGFVLLDIIEPFKKAFASTNMGRHVPLAKVWQRDSDVSSAG